MKLPVVRRSSYDRAFKVLEDARAADRAAHEGAMGVLRESFASLLADRDRSAARAERLAAEIALMRGRLEATAAAAAEADQLKKRIEDYRAECERLGAAQMALIEERGQWSGMTEAYKAECERLGAAYVEDRSQWDVRRRDLEAEMARLGAETIRLETEKSAWVAEQDELRAAAGRSALLIGTFPRSGTWMLKYFLHFLDIYCQTDEPQDIRAVYERVTGSQEYLLAFDAAPTLAQRVAISHWMCPGVFALPRERIEGFLGLLKSLDCLEYHVGREAPHAAFQPGGRDANVVYVFRNPLDVYRSYADIYERRVLMQDRKPYPFNPMAPFGHALMNSTSETPFEHFIDNFAESGFADFFIAHFMSYLLVQDAFPTRVSILRYEDAMADRAEYMKRVVDVGRVGVRRNERFDIAFGKAIEATDIKAMKGYEKELGHAISGAETFYGESNATHLSVKKRDWRTVFRQEHIDHLRDRIRAVEPRILAYLPDLLLKTAPARKKPEAAATEA